MVFIGEGIQGIKDNMKLLWDSKLLPAGDGHFFALWGVRISKTFFKIIRP
jgi:hypothetical protein